MTRTLSALDYTGWATGLRGNQLTDHAPPLDHRGDDDGVRPILTMTRAAPGVGTQAATVTDRLEIVCDNVSARESPTMRRCAFHGDRLRQNRASVYPSRLVQRMKKERSCDCSGEEELILCAEKIGSITHP
jgi:hypothetical protein